MTRVGRDSAGPLVGAARSLVPTAAIVGAGASGIAALRMLSGAGVEATAFELGQDVGGLWVYGNSNGLSAAYRSLHANTTKRATAFSELPMPDDFPDYPHHTQIAKYLNDYVDWFGGRSRIRFGARIVSAEPDPRGGWQVSVDESGQVTQTRFDAVVVCSGHHWAPQWPAPPYAGSFAGKQLHSHDFKEPEELAGLRVLIVGMGNSAMDIAEDISHVALRTYISARHGTHILPKYMFGRPLSNLTGPLMRLPWRARQAVLARLLTLIRGPYKQYGLQEPDLGIYQSHPTLSDTVLTRLAHGQIVPKPGISRLQESAIAFVDGSRADVDAIVWCTGYRIELPFLATLGVVTEGGTVPLYKRVFPIDRPGLAFIGLVSQRGALMPVVEEQSRIVADYLTGTYALPSREAMVDDIRRYDLEIGRRYLRTQRHTMEVEQGPFVSMLRRERNDGRRRATNTRGGHNATLGRREVVPGPPRAEQR